MKKRKAGEMPQKGNPKRFQVPEGFNAPVLVLSYRVQMERASRGLQELQAAPAGVSRDLSPTTVRNQTLQEPK